MIPVAAVLLVASSFGAGFATAMLLTLRREVKSAGKVYARGLQEGHNLAVETIAQILETNLPGVPQVAAMVRSTRMKEPAA